MRHWTLLTLLYVPLVAGTARAADDDAPNPLPPGPAPAVVPAPAVGVTSLPGHGEVPVPAVPVPAFLPPVQPQYPYLNAPLYPYPQPNVPVQVGSTMITNQALYPQEMLYPHDYKSLYPPYYQQAKGWWIWTPFGIKSNERWELLGTQVKVKYRSEVPIWTGWHAPHRKFFDYDENWNNPSASKYHGRHGYH